MTGKIFISYRRRGSKAITESIYRRLSEQFGRDDLFYDIDSLAPGVDWRADIREELKQASVVLAIIHEHWLEEIQARAADQDDVLRFELETALAKNVPVIPVLIDQTALPAARDLPPTLATLPVANKATVHVQTYFDQDMERLASGLVAQFGFKRRTASESTTKPRPPTADLVVPSSYMGPRHLPPRPDERWEKLTLPGVVQERWADRIGGREYDRPSMAVWVDDGSLYVRSRMHVVELRLPAGRIEADVQTGWWAEPKTLIELASRLLIKQPEDILGWTESICAGPNSAALVSDGEKIVDFYFAESPQVVARVAEKRRYSDRMTYSWSKAATQPTAFLAHCQNGVITLFDPSTRPYRVCSTTRALDLSGWDNRPALLWSASLKWLAQCNQGGSSNNLLVFQRDTNTLRPMPKELCSDATFYAMTWHPSQDVLAFTAWDFVINNWALHGFNFEAGAFAFKRRLNHTNVARGLAWNATGQFVATASVDGSVVVWDLMTGEDRPLFGHGEPVDRAEFSPDGQRLATFSENKVLIWDPRTGDEPVASWPGRAPWASFGEGIWSPDASMIVSVQGDVLEVRKLAT